VLTREKGGAMILAIFLVVAISVLLGRMNEWIFAGSDLLMKDKSASIAKVRSISQLGLGVSLLKHSGVVPANWADSALLPQVNDVVKCLSQFGDVQNGNLTSKDISVGSPEFIANGFRHIDFDDGSILAAGKIGQLSGADVLTDGSVLIVIGCGKFNDEMRAAYAILAKKDNVMTVIERKEA